MNLDTPSISLRSTFNDGQVLIQKIFQVWSAQNTRTKLHADKRTRNYMRTAPNCFLRILKNLVFLSAVVKAKNPFWKKMILAL